MSELIVREAADADGPALAELASAALGDLPGAAAEIADLPSLDRPASSFAARDGRLWVVMRGAEAVGALGVYRRERAEEFELALVGLDKESRGLGLATALLAGAEAFVRASGARRLGVWIDARLTEAIGFLERHEFKREPGVKGRHDGSDAVERRYTRALEPDRDAPAVAAEPIA